MPRKSNKIKIAKDKFRPRPRAPILPTKKFEDKRDREKHKKDPRRLPADE